MMQKQWIYQNKIVHKCHEDGLKTKEGEASTEITEILQEGKDDLEEEDKELLDHDWDEIKKWYGIQKN